MDERRSKGRLRLALDPANNRAPVVLLEVLAQRPTLVRVLPLAIVVDVLGRVRDIVPGREGTRTSLVHNC